MLRVCVCVSRFIQKSQYERVFAKFQRTEGKRVERCEGKKGRRQSSSGGALQEIGG